MKGDGCALVFLCVLFFLLAGPVGVVAILALSAFDFSGRPPESS